MKLILEKKVLTHFDIEGVEMRIVKRFEQKDKKNHIRVVAPNGGAIPIGIIQKRETLKSIQERTINALNDFKKRGADVKNELTRTLSL